MLAMENTGAFGVEKYFLWSDSVIVHSWNKENHHVDAGKKTITDM